MQINLSLFPSFLRISFAQTRLLLVGSEYNRPKPVLILNLADQHQKSFKKSFFTRTLNAFLIIISTLSFLTAGLLMVPDIYYRVFPADIQPIMTLEKRTPLGGDFDQGTQEKKQLVEEKLALPIKNSNLPTGSWLIIPRIGVRTEFNSTLAPAEALKQGVWMAPDYGKPGDEYNLPIILAAHRFGWDWWWQTDYWKYHSFYNLPELEPGDMVEIIADQRKWIYEIYAGEQGEEITDYEANLILYTCKFLNSPLRHFRYARLINLDQNTQT